MAKISSSTKTLIGIGLLVVGLGLAYWAYQISGSVSSQLNELVRGAPTDRVMLFYIAGVVSVVAGLFLIVKK